MFGECWRWLAQWLSNDDWFRLRPKRQQHPINECRRTERRNYFYYSIRISDEIKIFNQRFMRFRGGPKCCANTRRKYNGKTFSYSRFDFVATIFFVCSGNSICAFWAWVARVEVFGVARFSNWISFVKWFRMGCFRMVRTTLIHTHTYSRFCRAQVDEGIEAMLCCWLQQLQEFGGPEVDKPDLLKGSIGSLKNLGLNNATSATAKTASGTNSVVKHNPCLDKRARYNVSTEHVSS